MILWIESVMVTIVAYDISKRRRRDQASVLLKDYGTRVQYSVFECQFTETDLAQCRHVLSEIINHAEDQVLFVDLGPTEGRGERVITALGIPYVQLDAPCHIV